ncbi:MAG: hypothetical protein ACXVP0_11385 [Bacteroidia bacterium]
MKKINQLLTLSIGIVIAACGGSKEHDEHGEQADSTAVVAKDTTPVTVNEETKFKFDFAIANIPSPVGMVNEISNWGVPYNNTLLNDPKKSGTYNNEFTKAITLGIYNIDLSYAMLNNKGEDVLKLMKTTMAQAEGLGLKDAFDQMIGKRAEENISNKDSLLKILDEIFVKSDTYLRSNARVYTASVVFAGTWVEGLYLTCKIAEGVADPAVKAKAYKHVWEQRFHLNNLMTLLADYKDKKEAADLNADFKTIHDEIAVIKDPKDMDDAKFKAIAGKIYALRDKLTK